MGRRKLKKKIKKKSVTLIELLIAVSIFSLVGVGIYRAFSNSILVFQKIKQTNSKVNTLIFLEKFKHDLTNIVFDSTFYFQGKSNQATFFIQQDKYGKNLGGPVAKVEYTYNINDETIVRRLYPYKDDAELDKKIILENVKKLSLRYYYTDDSGKISKAFMQLNRLPYAVEIALKLADGKMHKAIIKIPLSG